jgi:hypothetical protein
MTPGIFGGAMPVTARLSKQFYDRLGEAITNELVDWFNQVDAAYKSDLRELNELNFARFDAKLEQRLASFEFRVEQRLLDFRAEMQVGFAKAETRMEAALKEQTRFYFLAWAVLLASNIALWLRG